MDWRGATVAPAMAATVTSILLLLWAGGLASTVAVAFGAILAAVASSYAVRAAGLEVSRRARELRRYVEVAEGVDAVDLYAVLLQVEAAARQLAAMWPLALGTGGLAGIPLSITAYHLAYTVNAIEARVCGSTVRLVKPLLYSAVVIASYGLASLILYPMLRGRVEGDGCRLQGEGGSGGSSADSLPLPAREP